LVYVVSLLVLFHAFLVGSDFTGGESRLPGLITLTSFIILLLKIGEGFKKVRQKPWSRERKSLAHMSLTVLLLVGVFLFLTTCKKFI